VHCRDGQGSGRSLIVKPLDALVLPEPTEPNSARTLSASGLPSIAEIMDYLPKLTQWAC
jgi:hypothetical protein